MERPKICQSIKKVNVLKYGRVCVILKNDYNSVWKAQQKPSLSREQFNLYFEREDKYQAMNLPESAPIRFPMGHCANRAAWPPMG